MNRAVLAVGAAVLALLLLAELAAVPVATRGLTRAVERCADPDEVRIAAIGRPALPGLLLGRARDVEVELLGVHTPDLRLDAVRVRADRIALPWAIGTPDPEEVRLDVRVLAEDLEVAVVERAPFGLRPTVELRTGVARLGVPPLPFTVDVAVEVDDGDLVFVPAVAPPDWWDRLGVTRRVELPDGVRVVGVELRPGRAELALVADGLPGATGADGPTGATGADGGHGCDDLLGAAAAEPDAAAARPPA